MQDDPPATCYECGRPVDRDRDACEACGAVQNLLCSCGATVSVHTPKCPGCGKSRVPRARRPRYRRALIVLAVAGLAAAGFLALTLLRGGDPDETRRTDFHEAWAAYQAGRFPDARVMFQRYIETHGEDPRALYMMGIALHRMNRSDEGVASARRALELDPTLAEAALFLAGIELRRGNLVAAKILAEQAAVARPQYVRAHALLGKILSHPGVFDAPRAVEHLEAAAAAGSDDPEVYVLLAELALARNRAEISLGGEATESRKWLRAALERAEALLDDPAADQVSLRFFLARCHYATREYFRAYSELTRAMKADPTLPEHRLLLGKIEYRRRNQEAARAIFDALAAECPSVGILLEIADFYAAEGEPEREEAIVDRARAAFPGSLPVVTRSVRILIANGQAGAAEAELRAALASNPEEPELQVALAETLLAIPGRSAEAEGILTARMDLGGPASPAALRLAELYLDGSAGGTDEEARLDRAEELIRSADLVEGPEAPPKTYLGFLLGKLAYRRGKMKEALDLLREVILRAPDDSAAHLLAARIHRATGDREQEIRELSTVMALRGESAELLEARAVAYLADGLATRAVRDAARAVELAPKSEDARLLLARAQASVRPVDLPGAIRTLQAATDLPDASVRSRVELARALAAIGNFDRARTELRRAGESGAGPDHQLLVYAALADVSDLIAGRRLGPEAEETLRAFVETYPDHLRGRLLLAARLLDVSRVADARQVLEGTVRQFAESSSARRLLFETCFGDAAGAGANLPLARDLSDEVLRLAPQSTDDLYMRGKLALLDRNADLARNLLEAAYRLAPGDDRAAHFFGLALYETGQADQAKRLLHKVIDRSPDMTSTRRLLARIAFEEGREAMRRGSPQQAAALLLLARERDPEAAGPSILLARALFTLGARGDAGALERARSECETVIAGLEGVDSPEARKVLAETLLLKADVSDARGDFEGVALACEGYLRLHPDEARVRLRLAVARIVTTGPEAALPLLTKLHAEQAGNAEVLAVLSFVLGELGRGAEAVAAARRSVAENPDAPHLRVVLASVLARAGDDAAALDEARRAVELDPDYLPAADALFELVLRSQGPSEAARVMRAAARNSGRKGELAYLEGRALLAADPADPEGVRLLVEALEAGIASRAHRAACVVKLLDIRAASRSWDEVESLGAGFREWAEGLPEFQSGGPLARWAAEVRFYLGLSAHDRGRLELAEHNYRRAISLYPYYPSALNNLACILCLDEGRVQEAIRLASRAVEFLPGNPEYHDTMALVLDRAGQTGEALRAVARAEEILTPAGRGPAEVDRKRRLARVLVRKAALLVKTRERDGAQAALDRAAELDPLSSENERWRTVREGLDALR